ncbi:MAG: LamG-like jellyroll fold domain-containing protein, partial [Mariniphaga sp.]|nr:LamG-like jellyroll fold domain-containing protein [Mariniphaga sp.]
MEDYPVWIEMMEQPDVPMSEIREAFDSYWENHEHHRGDRSKQFEQWYAMNSRRLDEYGKVISSRQVSSEFQRLKLKSGLQMEGNWINYGPISVGPRNSIKKDGGRVKDIEFHPTDSSTFYVSTFKGGLFRTRNYGTTWEAVTDHLTEQVFVCEVSDVDPNIIFIGTDNGVYKSIDEGANWEPSSIGSETKSLLLKNDDQNVIIAGTQIGIYRSDDGGETWALVLAAEKIEDLDSHPAKPEILYAATNGSESEFFRSMDGGQNWIKNNSFGKGCFMGIAVSPAAPDNVYVINLRDHLGDDSFEGFYFSDDSGTNFHKQSGYTPCISGYKNDGAISRGQPNYNLFVCVDPQNPDLIYAGGIHPWKSEDKGKTWTYLNTQLTADGGEMHVDQLNWAYSPHDNNIFAANDGGIYLLQTDGKFRTLTDGLPIAEIYECSQSQTMKTNVAGGTMHCGVKLNYQGEWFTPWGGDEATCIIDPTDENFIYHLKYEKISRSSDGGFSFSRINSQDADRGYYTGTGVIDHQSPNILYVGLLEVERTRNARDTDVRWEKISGFGGNEKIQKVEQCMADREILYVARGNSFYRSDNVSQVSPSFINLTNSLPSAGQVTDIATHPSNQNLVYILLGSRVFKSSDKGISWTSISENLPQVALLEMTIDKSASEGIYIGTDIGVYYKDSTMTDWIDYSKNLPGIRVSGMDIYYGETREESFITISTDGRGFWRSLLYGISGNPPVANFTVDKTSVFTTEPVSITNTSPDDPVSSFKWTIEGGSPSVSFEQNPVVLFNEPGTYKIILDVMNSVDTVQKSIDIRVNALSGPQANFTVNETTVYSGGFVVFNDASQNIPSSWEWIFEGGEPATSTEQNPVVTYHNLGTFDVSLKVTNSAGNDSIQKNGFITVIENEGTGELQAHYEFNKELVDLSSYKRDLVIIGDYTAEFTTDRLGNLNEAYLSPGNNNQYLSASYKGIEGNHERTVTAWYKTSASGPARKTIISWGRNVQGEMFNLMVYENGRIRVEAGSCNVQCATENLNDGQWHHVAITYNPADGAKLKDVKIYVDGQLDTNRPDGAGESYRSEEVNINTNVTENNIRIGSVKYADYYFNGS